ncbi:MAG: FAD/NAD(P)-binding protein [Pseudobdellovibrio sp.]
MHIYDYIIIGSGLTGLTIAKKISQETDNVLILEAQEFTGGTNHPAKLNNQNINSGLRFFPASDAANKALSFLEQLLGQDLKTTTAENNIETYEASGFKKFIGFGEKSPEFYEQLSYFLNKEEQLLSQNPYQWTQLLAEQLNDKIQTKSIVTRFGFEALDSENPRLTHVIVNGNKQVYAHNFIFAGPAKELGLLIPDDVMNVRAKAKLKKSTAWQGVCVDLFHTAQIEKTNQFLLNGTTDDELGPCIGRFLAPVEGGQISQWMSFIDSESAEDTENIALVLKKIKRQIKRAFPEVGESIKKERISVSPVLSGADLKLNANGTFPKVANLWIGSSQVSACQNLLGSLMQAQFVLSSLGFIPIAPQAIIDTESSLQV